jgi:Spy/CpxP family protein refolding chaperone
MKDGDKKCMMTKGFKKLNLTADQKTKLDALKEECRQEAQPLREQMMAKRTELRALWLEDNPNAEKIKAAQKDMGLLRDQMMDKMTTFRLAALTLLTPEQKAEYKKFCQEKNWGKEKEGKSKQPNKVKGKDKK